MRMIWCEKSIETMWWEAFVVEAVRTGSKGRYEAKPKRVNKNECVVERGHGTGVGNLDYTFSMCSCLTFVLVRPFVHACDPTTS